MKPNDKARELMLKYYNAIPMNTISFAKQFALIAVEEIINEFYTHPIAKIYWQEVKQEIEKL
jgi:hypothetical protein